MFQDGSNRMIFDSRFQIEVQEGVDKGKKYPLRSKEITLGRRLIPNEKITHWILFNEPTVSRMHAMLIWDDKEQMYVLHHKSKTNPTLVNGLPVEKKELWSGDRIVMGLLSFKISLQAGPIETNPITEKIEPHFFKDVPRDEEFQQEMCCLELTVGLEAGTTFPLRSSIVLLGRKDIDDEAMGQNEILIQDYSIPREHLLLVWNAKEHTYGVIKVESSPLLSHVKRTQEGLERLLEINSERHVLLAEGDELMLGDTIMAFGRRDLSLGGIPDKKRELSSKTSVALKEPKKMRSLSLDVLSRPSPSSRSVGSKGSHKEYDSRADRRCVPQGGEPGERPQCTSESQGNSEAGIAFDLMFTVVSGPDRGKIIALLKSDLHEDRVLTMGRKGVRLNDIVFNDPSMENVQAHLLFKKGKLFLENEYTDTTFTINGEVVHSGKSVQLCTADRIQIGRTILVYRVSGCEMSHKDFRIEVRDGVEQDIGKAWNLCDRQMIGRSQSCDIQILDEEVAPEHALLSFEQECFYLELMSPAHLAIVSGLATVQGEKRQIYPDDCIRLSKQSLLLFKRSDDK
jgi:pSer/pThr/pTyr-binding forkhead associated (FHA) protein